MNYRLLPVSEQNFFLAPELQIPVYLPPAPSCSAPAKVPSPPIHDIRPAGTRQREFFRQMLPYALTAQRLTGVPASVSLAQAALESGWGKHAPGNNFFCIKGTGPAGSQWIFTREYRGGALIRTKAKFRRYHDPQQSFIDHARVIAEGRYLRHAMRYRGDARRFVHALQSGTYKYATDPRYEAKVMKIIQSYGLQRYDRTEP